MIKSFFLFFVSILLVGCEYRPPENGNSEELNEWFVSHFDNKQTYFYKFVRVFEDKGLDHLSARTLACDSIEPPRETCFTQDEMNQYSSWFNDMGHLFIRREDYGIIFYEGAPNYSKNGRGQSFWNYFTYIYSFEDQIGLPKSCDFKQKIMDEEKNFCIVKLDDSFILEHAWEISSNQ